MNHPLQSWHEDSDKEVRLTCYLIAALSAATIQFCGHAQHQSVFDASIISINGLNCFGAVRG
jgi:hypothetical protein